MAASVWRVFAILKPTNLLATGLLVAVGYGGWLAYNYIQDKAKGPLELQKLQAKNQQLEAETQRMKDKIGELQEDNEELERLNEELEGFVERLTDESPVAEVRVLDTSTGASGVPEHEIEFRQQDREGNWLKPRRGRVRGKEFYVEAFLIKFADEEVMKGDPLRGKSIHVFHRLYGTNTAPADGPLLCAETKDGVPDFYRSDLKVSEFEKRLWRLFWYYSEHPRQAELDGVRVLQKDATGTRAAKGATYRMSIEHDGGLNMKRTVPGEEPGGPPKPADPPGD
jgi:cell division protein FtsB